MFLTNVVLAVALVALYTPLLPDHTVEEKVHDTL